ncbi:hypothetical protein DPMN_015789 [Dreissena polymorpha]|uniref:Uncharacterized protein n=1 Tax=Dreissena polymorpha TaxID=45954 RepID=A0A9D4NDA9_DREPO|nr:hypothetical protein DPMN_015789 [Dreissena polymorpha]
MKETRGQSVCPRLFEHRKEQITGMKAHDVFVIKVSSNTDNLVRHITGSKCYNLSGKAAVKWEITMKKRQDMSMFNSRRGITSI